MTSFRRTIEKSNPTLLAGLFSVDDNSSWNDDDFSAMLKHQMNADLWDELSEVGAGTDDFLQSISCECRRNATFADILHSSHPHVELLKVIKNFAKRHRNNPDSPIPREISTVLYLTSIAVAVTRCQQRISDLDAESLGQGFNWALSLSWLDNTTRALIAAGAENTKIQ